MLTLELIKEAAARIQGRVHRTPVLTSRAFNERAGCEVFFKCENLQRAGAFKIRGATNKILSLTDEEKQRGVAAFSSGNHAQAVALAAREAGIRAVIAMPDDAPKAKVAATRGYGAEIVFYDRLKQDREAVAIELARARRAGAGAALRRLSHSGGSGHLRIWSLSRRFATWIVCWRRAAAAACSRASALPRKRSIRTFVALPLNLKLPTTRASRF